MVSHHSAKFGSNRHCGSGDMLFLVAEEENSRFSRFNLPLLFISKGHGLKAHNISYNYLRSWSHALKVAIGQKFENKYCHSV